MIKLFYGIGIALLLVASVFEGSGLFMVMTQSMELKQWLFVAAAISSIFSLWVLHFTRRGNLGLYLFFFTYPFLSQGAYYVNLSSSFFIITPALAYLLVQLFLSKAWKPSFGLCLLFLFCISTFTIVFVSDNVHLAMAFWVAGVGSFALSAYLAYSAIIVSKDPLRLIRKMFFAIIAGSCVFFAMEVVFFGIRPSDILLIMMRKWEDLSADRYYTAGYREPAGLAFIITLCIWVVLFQLKGKAKPKNKFDRWISLFMLGVSGFFLFIAGTRAALLNFVSILIVHWLLRQRLGFRNVYRLKKGHVVLLIILVSVGGYLLIPRTLEPASAMDRLFWRQKYWLEPTYISVAGRTFRLVGTTASYLQKTHVSLQDLVHNPLGTGPFEATPTTNQSILDKEGPRYHYSFITNFITIGADFGWLSLALWMLFIFYVFWDTVRLKRKMHNNQQLYGLTVLLLAIVIASILPGSYYLGPKLNWSGFNRDFPISPEFASVPADYPAVMSGFIIGCLLGLLSYIRKVNWTEKVNHDCAT